MIGIIQSTKAEKRRRKISDSQNRLHQQVERAFLRSYKSWLNGVTRDILGRLESFGTTQVNASDLFVPALHSRSFSEKLLPRWNLTVWSGVQFEADWIDSQEARQSLIIARQALQLPSDMEPPPSINVDPSPGLMRSVRDYMRERQVGVWGQVTRTTHKTLDRTIRKAIEQGDDLDQMTARVRGVLSNYSDYQARRVARTEVTTGMNHGGQIERDELGIEEKEWVSTIDARNRGADASSRFDHLTPDGQVVANNKAFVVSGQELMYPGDSSRGASAGNVIHCRCSAVASFGKGTQPPPKPARKVKPKKPETPKEKTPDIKPVTEDTDRLLMDTIDSGPVEKAKARAEYKKATKDWQEAIEAERTARKDGDAFAIVQHSNRQRVAKLRAEAYRLSAESKNGKAFLEYKLQQAKELEDLYKDHEKLVQELIDSGVKLRPGYQTIEGLTPREDWMLAGTAEGISPEQIKKAKALRKRLDQIQEGAEQTGRRLYYNEPKNLRTLPARGAGEVSELVPVQGGGASKEFREYMEQSEQRIAINDAAARGIAESGKVRTVFDTGKRGDTTSEAYYLRERAGTENRTFGLPEDAEPANRPVYGFMEHPDRMASQAGEVTDCYGKYQLVLKPEVKQRSTYTIGDSMNHEYGTARKAAPINNPIDPKDLKSERYDFEWKGDGVASNIDYVEFQTWGGVELKDIEKIILPKGADLPEDVAQRYIEAGVKIEKQEVMKYSQPLHPDDWDNY